MDLATASAPHLVTELPGPKARAVIERDGRVVSSCLGRVYPLVPARAQGLVIEDVDGNRFLDVNAGIAVNSTGHAHPKVVEAIEAQARSLLHYCSSDFYVPIYVELCERLAASAPFGDARVYLGNSGTEVVEAAIKLARLSTGRQYVIAFHGGFHGRTMGSLSLTASKARYRSGYGPLLPGVHHAPYAGGGDPDGARFIEQVLFCHLVEPHEVAAVVVEPVQGEGGYRVPPDGWLADLRALCDAHGIVLVADEVQSGMGRTGAMWAVEHWGLEPDILLAGKGLASGLPLAAMIAKAELADWGPGKHGSTFGGNPVACAAAVATFDLVAGGLADNAAHVGERLAAKVAGLGHAAITEVRGKGLMIGVELATPELAQGLEQAAFHRGLLALTCGERTVRLAPPLVITDKQADTAVAVLAQALADLSR